MRRFPLRFLGSIECFSAARLSSRCGGVLLAGSARIRCCGEFACAVSVVVAAWTARRDGGGGAEEADKELEVHPGDAAGSVRLTDH